MSTKRMIQSERGGAMVISLLVLMMLTMVTTLFIAKTKTETQIAGHDMRATQALFNAEAGYAEVLARMSDANDVDNYIGQAYGEWNTTPGWGRYVVLAAGNSAEDPARKDLETDGLDNNGDGSADELDEGYPEIQTKQSGEDAIEYPWVSVRYKLNATNQPLLFGDHDNDITTPSRPNLTRGYPIIVVTAMGGRGSSNRTIEVEAVKVPIDVVNTALYSETDDFNFNGTQFLVSGKDHDINTGAEIVGADEVPGIVTTEDPNAISGSLNAQQQNNIEGEGSEPSSQPSDVDMDLDALREVYLEHVEYEVPAGTYDDVAWGSIDDYTVVHCTGDMHTSGNISGGGVLIVDGDLDVSGSFTWYGLILVMGSINFTGGGAGIHLYGATLVKGDGGTSTISGNADIFYSSEALSKLVALSPYTVYNWRELS